MEQVCCEPERLRPIGVAAVAETPTYLCVAAASEGLSLWWSLASPVLGLRCLFFWTYYSVWFREAFERRPGIFQSKQGYFLTKASACPVVPYEVVVS